MEASTQMFFAAASVVLKKSTVYHITQSFMPCQLCMGPCPQPRRGDHHIDQQRYTTREANSQEKQQASIEESIQTPGRPNYHVLF